VYREREKEREKERKNREKIFFEKKELPPKKIKNKIKKCSGTSDQDGGVLVSWYQGSHIRSTHLTYTGLFGELEHLNMKNVVYYEWIKREL
jgi:hypothetical protein